MLAMISGTVIHRGGTYIIVSTGALGYRISLPEEVVRAWQGEVTCYTHEVVRENERELFGFESVEAIELFWKLTSVSGVGPRSAQRIIYADTLEVVAQKLAVGDLSFLTSISGIGNKTAKKIILELKGVLAQEADYPHMDEDAIAGLTALGYTKKQAQEALTDIEGDSTEERLRHALKRLGRS